MPIVDLPLEELWTYRGRNPRPADHDAYWEAALAEMKGTDAQVELRPYAIDASFAECFDLYFTGVGGSRIHAKYLRPKQAATPHPAVLMFHGYSGSSGEWADKLNYVARGYSVAALDCRGQGGYSEDRGGAVGNTLRGHIIRGLSDTPDKLLFRQIFLDTAQLELHREIGNNEGIRVHAEGGRVHRGFGCRVKRRTHIGVGVIRCGSKRGR